MVQIKKVPEKAPSATRIRPTGSARGRAGGAGLLADEPTPKQPVDTAQWTSVG